MIFGIIFLYLKFPEEILNEPSRLTAGKEKHKIPLKNPLPLLSSRYL